MSLNRQIARLQSRVKKAREFYSKNKPWSRTLAWEILTEIAEESSDYNRKTRLEIAGYVEEGDTYSAFRVLGECAKSRIEDLVTAREEGYDVDEMKEFQDWTEQSHQDNWG